MGEKKASTCNWREKVLLHNEEQAQFLKFKVIDLWKEGMKLQNFI